MKIKLKLLIIIAVFGLGMFLRLWKYPFFPFAGHAEEYLFVWSGLSLIEKGVPISWNDLPVYQEKDIYWQGIAPNQTGGGLGVRLLKPWLDEPPLFSLIVGSVAKIYNQTNFTIISPYIIRLPSLFFAFLTMGAVFYLAKKLFGFKVGLLSLLIYATTPIIVFGSRLAVPENLITLLMMASLILMLSYLDTRRSWQRNASFLLVIIAGLCKPTGILLVFLLAYLLWQKKHWKEGIIGTLSSILIYSLSYFAYGFYFDKDLFLKVFLYQSQRPAGWSGITYLFTNPGFSIEVFLDGFIVLGFCSLFFLLFRKRTREENLICLFFVFTLMVVILTGGRHDQLTWYRYPVYPFLAISLALMLKEFLTNPSFLLALIFFPLLMSNLDLLEDPFWKMRFLLEARVYRFVLPLLIMPALVYDLSNRQLWLKISKIAVVLVFLLSILINFLVVTRRFNSICDNTNCPLPEKINLIEPFMLK